VDTVGLYFLQKRNPKPFFLQEDSDFQKKNGNLYSS